MEPVVTGMRVGDPLRGDDGPRSPRSTARTVGGNQNPGPSGASPPDRHGRVIRNVGGDLLAVLRGDKGAHLGLLVQGVPLSPRSTARRSPPTFLIGARGDPGDAPEGPGIRNSAAVSSPLQRRENGRREPESGFPARRPGSPRARYQERRRRPSLVRSEEIRGPPDEGDRDGPPYLLGAPREGRRLRS